IKNAKSDKDRVVLLMHCGYISKNSVKALPEVIKYYKNNGYEFKAITEDTPEEYHIIK
ncbi:polysaccharide deacetylase, partial [Clostridium botulinum]|nr:polysaccharide deacetylase [Clostridium botulinum]